MNWYKQYKKAQVDLGDKDNLNREAMGMYLSRDFGSLYSGKYPTLSKYFDVVRTSDSTGGTYDLYFRGKHGGELFAASINNIHQLVKQGLERLMFWLQDDEDNMIPIQTVAFTEKGIMMKTAQTEQPLTRQEVEQHLISRGFDPQKYRWDYDEEGGTVYIRLYESGTGRLKGLQEYRPHIKEKGRNDGQSEYGRKRYFNQFYHHEPYKKGPNVKEEFLRGRKNDEAEMNKVFWGWENVVNSDKDYIFVTEGVFDAAPINMLGEPAIAVLGADVTESKINELRKLNKRLISIDDNDPADGPAQKKGKWKVWKVIKKLGGQNIKTPYPYKDFGEFFEADKQGASNWLKSLVS